MPPTPRLLSLATAVPPFVLHQDAVARAGAALFGDDRAWFERMAPVYRNAQIETRYSCVPIDWYLQPRPFSERNERYLDNAVSLLAEVAEDAIAQAGLTPADIDMLVTVSSTGIATPSLDARLMERLAFRRDVARLPVFGLGCAGGALGLGRAAALARGQPDCNILLLVVELCGLTFRRNDRSKSNVIATALFGDGAAGAVLSCAGDGPAVTGWGEHTWPGSLDVMGWDAGDDGLTVIFSRDIPTLIRTEYRPVLDAFLDRQGLDLSSIDHVVCHPGGAKVLDALEDVLGYRSGGLTEARDVLRDYGNMSAVTVLFVLAQARAGLTPGRRFLLSSLGPGFTVGFALLEGG